MVLFSPCTEADIGQFTQNTGKEAKTLPKNQPTGCGDVLRWLKQRHPWNSTPDTGLLDLMSTSPLSPPPPPPPTTRPNPSNRPPPPPQTPQTSQPPHGQSKRRRSLRRTRSSGSRRPARERSCRSHSAVGRGGVGGGVACFFSSAFYASMAEVG